MDANKKSNTTTFLMAKNVADIFYHIKTVQRVQLLGGCTQTDEYHDKVISIRNINELKSIDKRERYIDIGPAATLSEIYSMGRANIPPVLYDAIGSISTEQVRNIATLAGNICANGQKQTLFAPLLALDARIEIKSAGLTKYIPFTKFTKIPESFVITKIRIPLNDWEVSVFRRTGPVGRISEQSASFVFLLDSENDLIVNLKIAFAGVPVFRSRELENKLIGARLPLSEKTIETFLESAKKLSEPVFTESHADPILKNQFLNLLNYELELLT